MNRDVRPHCFFVHLNPPFRDPNFSFTGLFVANPATKFPKKREGHSAEMQKKHENTTVLKKQKRTTIPAKNNYRCKSLINSKTISVSEKITELIFCNTY